MFDYLIDTRESDQQEGGVKTVSPLSESSRSSFDSAVGSLQDIFNDEQKQQNLESLANILDHLDHDDTETRDEEVKQGVASFLVKVLHSTLRRHATDSTRDSYFVHGIYRDRLGEARALRLSIICTALEMVLRCSDAAMIDFMYTMPRETLPSLVILVEIITVQDGCRTVRDVIQSKVAKILKRLCANGMPIRIVVIEALFLLLARGETDTRIDAACALSSLVTRRNDSLHSCTITKIEQSSHLLVTTLTIAASALPEEQVEDVLGAILNLTTFSDILLVSVARRIGTIRVLNLTMKSTRAEIRLRSFMISESLLGSIDGFTELFTAQPLNGEVLLKGLASAVLLEEKAELQHFVTCILTTTLANMNSSLGHAITVTNALATVADAAIENRTSHEAAVAICNKAPSFETPASVEIACTIVSKLAQSSIELIRSKAIQALSELCSRASARRFLASQEPFHEAIVSNVKDGNEHQASTAMYLLDQVVGDEANRFTICTSPNLIDMLVEFVVANTSSSCRIQAVELTLSLIKDPSCITGFLQYTDLLPAIIALANSNASSKKLKKETVEAIVQLATHFLED